ncbi:RHS repeat domain-containing protein, partial [Prevotella sp. oral taxon 317]
NILGIVNAVDPTQANSNNNNNSNNNSNNNKAKLGGAFNHTYAYDDLNRLIRANGEAKGAKYEMTMTFGRMSEPLTKVQKVDSTKTAQSYDFTYKYEDSNHPTAPTQIGHEHYTYDANGNPTLVENDSLNTERRMYWDEDNRLMVLSDNGKTSRYTYNAAGERIVKSHGDLEGVYVNGAPQGMTFHETEDYTIYPAPIITVTKNRFTKHYFIGDKRIASKLGTGKFSNVYGISSNNVTAGQKDYAARMLQIEKQREEYYKSLGTPPGVPTMKGATADPDNTGYGYNTIIGDLGDHSVPEGWVQRPKFNDRGDVPGPPIQWQKPEDPDNAQPGYGYVPADTAHHEDIFFYHSDHLGSTSYITDAKANITQFDAYLPYGELLVDEHSSSEEMPYKFNGKELDQETGLYYYGARYMNPVTSLWYGVDPQIEKMPKDGAYSYCFGNPIKLIDPNGERPTEEEAARISAHVYRTEKVTLTGGWHLSKLNNKLKGVIWNDASSGFKSALYERTYKGKTEYVYATAGTDFTEVSDWKNNIKQLVGMSEQYDISMRNAEKISQVTGNSELTFTGHSLGGGLAAANAYKTGRSAMTFNAAWVSPFTVFSRKLARIDAYINWGDELNTVQSAVGLRADGVPHYRFNRRALLGHSIQNFYRTDLELMKDNIKAKNELYQRMYMESFHGFPQ